MNKQNLIERVASTYFKARNIHDPPDDYIVAIQRTIETMAFYDKGDTKLTAVIPLETGQGKSSLLNLLMPELYAYDKPNSGSIILLPYRNQCDRLCRDINEIAGTNIAASYHSKARIRRKELKKYPILVMTHNRFLSGIEELATYSCWMDFDNIHEISNEPIEYMRKRLIIDESINKIELLSISASTLNLLDNFFQEQKNTKDFIMWQTISSKIREMFVLPVLSKEQNKTIPVQLDEEIPKRLIEVVKLRANTLKQDSIQRAFKAVMNLSIDGGMLKTSKNPQYRIIQTVNYINIFSPLFTSIVLDGTARINQTYHNKYFDIIDIPRTKRYNNVTIHIEDKANGSRSAIEKDKTLIMRTIQYINEKLTDKNILLICHKNLVEEFINLPKNISVAHWGSFNGSNKYNDKDCIVYCGTPFVDESYYIYLYHLFSGDKDYSTKNRLYKPRGKADRTMRFIKEPLYEKMRQSYLAVEFVQSINRGVCRNYNNDIPMHCFLPFGDYEVLNIIQNELVGINIDNDYNLLDEDTTISKKEENKRGLVDIVTDVLLNHTDYFENNEAIGKSELFELDLIKNNFKCESKAIQSNVWKSPEVQELENMGFLKITKKTVQFMEDVA